MAELSTQEVYQVIEIMINHLQKIGALPALTDEMKAQLMLNVATSLQNNHIQLTTEHLQDKKALNQLCGSIVTAFVAPPGQGMDKTIGLMMKNELTPEENQKLELAAAYISAMKNQPGLKLNLELVFKDQKTMTEKEKQEFTKDLTAIITNLNDKEKNPDMKLTGPQLKKLIEKVQKEIEKDPGMTKVDLKKLIDEAKKEIQSKPGLTYDAAKHEEDEALSNASISLFGIDISTPGKISGPVQALTGNLFGVADNFPAMSDGAAIHRFSGDILSSSQAATGVEALAADRDLSIGEDLQEAFKGAGIELDQHSHNRPTPFNMRPMPGGGGNNGGH